MRKKHSPQEKTQMVLDVLQGESTLSEIASRNNVHPNLLTRWKTQAVNGMPHLFENETAKIQKQSRENEREKEELYKQIGKLTTQMEWLKKKSNY
jgi:transposase-like protein